MVNLLRRIFIKDYKNLNDNTVREKHGTFASIVGILSNIVLFSIKLFTGIISGSISIIGDAINNLSDMGSSLITLIGFKLSNKEADTDHPFGHQRIEYITGLIVSLIIMFVGFELGLSSIDKIKNPNETIYSTLVIVLLITSVFIKLWQGLFNRKMGKIINSVALVATSQDSFNDAITTIVILICALISKYLGYNLDAYAGIFVALFIIYSGLKLLKDSVDPLIGTSIELSFVKQIEEDIKKFEGICGIHDVICHKYGPTKIFMSLHAEVPSSMNFMLAHDLIDQVEVEMKRKYDIELTIHLDPVDTNCELTKELKNKLNEFMNESEYRDLHFHDFRIVKGVTHTNVLFDVELPFEIKHKKDEITKYFESKFKEIDDKYNLVITYDYIFVK